MTDGLKDVHREAIIGALAANDRVERAVLFGSRATGTNTVTSDVDIALFGDRMTLTDRARLAAVINEIPMAQSVDLLLYDSISDQTLREHIRNHGVEWYPRATHQWRQGVYGRVPVEYVEKPLESLCVPERGIQTGPFGSQLHKRDYVSEGTPIVTVEHLGDNRLDHSDLPRVSDEDRDRLSRYRLKAGDIVFSRVGSVDRRALVRQEEEGWLFSGRCLRVRGDPDRIDRTFLSYFFGLNTFREHIRAIAVGATMPSLNTRLLSSIVVPCPPLPEQGAIAHVLGTVDDKIELNRRMNETLETMARVLFKSWFVDFDPVRAKRKGWDTGLPSDITDLFPDRLVDSELGEIPEGWEAGTLNDVARLNPESWSSRNAPESIRYVDLANTKWGSINDIQEFTWENAPSRGRRVLRRGDTIVGTVRPRNGSFALIDRDGLTGSTAFAVLRPATPIERELVWCAATSEESIERLAHLADGGAYPAVRPTAVLDTAVALPDPPIRLAFSSLVEPLVGGMGMTQRESRTLAALRDALLPKLVSGEIRLEKAASIIGEIP